jgi:PEP-CTERM motif
MEAAPIMVGDTIKFQDGPGTTGGGEFTVTINGLDAFVTFCLQRTQYIDFSTTFVVAGVSSYVSTDNAAHGGDAFGHDPLSPQTAWLYTQFRAGTLAGYDYIGATRAQSADALQNAIWWFENEITTNPNNAFVTAANAAVLNGWTGLGDVRVLNLQFPNGPEAQDQLGLVPEPSTLTLFGSALAAMAWRKRRVLAGRRKDISAPAA